MKLILIFLLLITSGCSSRVSNHDQSSNISIEQSQVTNILFDVPKKASQTAAEVFDIGTVPINGSITKIFTLTNATTSNITLNFTDLQTQISANDRFSMNLLTATQCGLSLKINKTCSFEISLKYNATGIQDYTQPILTNIIDPASQGGNTEFGKVMFTGSKASDLTSTTALAGVIKLNTLSDNFIIPQGGNQTKRFYIGNIGAGLLKAPTIVAPIGGTISTNACVSGSNIKPNGTCFFDINYAYVTGASSNEQIGFISTDPLVDMTNLKIQLAVTMQAAVVPTVSANFTQVGSITDLTSTTQTTRLYITNNGSTTTNPLLTVIPSPYIIASTSCSTTLKVGKTCFFDLKIDPSLTSHMITTFSNIKVGTSTFSIKAGLPNVKPKCEVGFSPINGQCMTVGFNLVKDIYQTAQKITVIPGLCKSGNFQIIGANTNLSCNKSHQFSFLGGGCREKVTGQTLTSNGQTIRTAGLCPASLTTSLTASSTTQTTINPNSNPMTLISVNNSLYFFAQDYSTNTSLFSLDTSTDTLTNIIASNNINELNSLPIAGNKPCFKKNNDSFFYCAENGTTVEYDTTVLNNGLYANLDYANIAPIQGNNFLMYIASSGFPYDLAAFNGSSVNLLFKDFLPDQSYSLSLDLLNNIDGTTYFVGPEQSDPTYQQALWKTDGTQTGTKKLAVAGTQIGSILKFKNKLYVVVSDTNLLVTSLFEINPSTDSVDLVSSFTTEFPYNPSFDLVATENYLWLQLFYNDQNGDAQTNIYTIDSLKNVSLINTIPGVLSGLIAAPSDKIITSNIGSTTPIILNSQGVVDLFPVGAYYQTNPYHSIILDGKAYFTVTLNNGTTSVLYSSDGTANGTIQVTPDTIPIDPTSLYELNGVLYFSATSSVIGKELFKFVPSY